MRKKTNKEVVENFKKVHGDRYGYGEVVYTGATSKVRILCKKHGIFEQRPNHHLQGHNCPKCASRDTGSGRRTRKPINDVLKDFKKVHGNRYDYSEVVYKSARFKVKILCKKHGVFEQRPNHHLQGNGCPKCLKDRWRIASERNRILKVTSKEDRRLKNESMFIEKASKVHNNFYNYGNVFFINYRTYLNIECPKHGVILINPHNHINGTGCKQCSIENEYTYCGLSKERWAKSCLKLGKTPKVYHIKIKIGDEVFYKIGKTYMDVSTRISAIRTEIRSGINKDVMCSIYASKINISIDVLKIVESNSPNYINELESKAHRIYKHYKYLPSVEFGGHTECFA